MFPYKELWDFKKKKKFAKNQKDLVELIAINQAGLIYLYRTPKTAEKASF